MTLIEYFQFTGLKKAFFAEKLNVPKQTLSTWINGRKMPRIETIMKIEEATGGKVKPKDWIKQPNKENSQQK